MNLFNRFVREDAGQDLIEYALLAALISMASIAAITGLGTALQEKYLEIAPVVTGAGS